MDATIMKMCCDFCRGKLGLMVHRYWRMRFCSSACAQGYEQRLDETKARIRRVNYSTSGDAAVMDGLPGLPALGSSAGI
jgi:hypothetical protein